jgi:hypothetical protein
VISAEALLFTKLVVPYKQATKCLSLKSALARSGLLSDSPLPFNDSKLDPNRYIQHLPEEWGG